LPNLKSFFLIKNIF